MILKQSLTHACISARRESDRQNIDNAHLLASRWILTLYSDLLQTADWQYKLRRNRQKIRVPPYHILEESVFNV